LGDFVVRRDAAVVHVIAHVGSNEVVLRDGIVHQILSQLLERPSVFDAADGTDIFLLGYIIEINERIVTHGVRIFIRKRAVCSRNISS